MNDIVALLVGDAQRTEFREAVDALRSSCSMTAAVDVTAAESMLAQGLVPDLIVIAQAFPGQVTTEQVERLRRAAPLARVLGLLGSWCEGEARTGRPWPGVIRVYWHQWTPRCRSELRALAQGRCSSWGLPSTASDEERFLTLAEQTKECRHGLIAIYARQYEMQDWLVAACRRRGYATAWLHGRQPVRVEGASALVFDFEGELDAELGQLDRWASTLGRVPTIALVNFPRIGDEARLRTGGVRAVLSKPVLLDDLYCELDRLTGRDVA